MILFGSQAKGTANLMSDVDLAIVCADIDKIDRLSVAWIVSEFMTKIDVVYTTEERLNSADKWSDVNYWIKKEGVVLWQR
ncbi:MAG: nucleotidyltransferase domain-containing protein [Oscillospiraceae bacterium]|nr:nucleotidyltransferase domain-containing protein [Oscillospiraceae bacterium]